MERGPIIGYGPDEEGASVERLQEVDQWIQQAEDIGLTAAEIDTAIAALNAMKERRAGETTEVLKEAESVLDEAAEKEIGV